MLSRWRKDVRVRVQRVGPAIHKPDFSDSASLLLVWVTRITRERNPLSAFQRKVSNRRARIVHSSKLPIRTIYLYTLFLYTKPFQCSTPIGMGLPLG